MLEKRIMLVKIKDQSMDSHSIEKLLEENEFGGYIEETDVFKETSKYRHFLTYTNYEAYKTHEITLNSINPNVEVVSTFVYRTLDEQLMPSLFYTFAKKIETKILCPHCYYDLKPEKLELLSYTCFKFDENTSTYKPYLVYDYEAEVNCPDCGEPVDSAISPYLHFKDIRLD